MKGVVKLNINSWDNNIYYIVGKKGLGTSQKFFQILYVLDDCLSITEKCFQGYLVYYLDFRQEKWELL